MTDWSRTAVDTVDPTACADHPPDTNQQLNWQNAQWRSYVPPDRQRAPATRGKCQDQHISDKYVRRRGLTYIHTCRCYVHTPRKLDRHAVNVTQLQL